MVSLPKTRVRSFDKQDGTHVRQHDREIPSQSSYAEELPPEGYEVEATVKGNTDEDGELQDAKVTEVKIRPKDASA